MSLPLTDLISLTWRALYTNPLRSTLTTLGVFMGVTAVTATLQVGSISRRVITQQLAEREAPQVSIYPQWMPENRQQTRLTQAELDFLEQRLSGLEAISSTAWIGSELTIFQDREAYPAIFATTEQHIQTTGRTIVEGRFFAASDFSNFHPVVVIDQQLKSQLFQDQTAVGQRLYVRQQPFVIVGILAAMPSDNNPTDGQLLIPTTVSHAIWGQNQLGRIHLRPQRLDQLVSLGSQAEQLLAQRFPGQEFWVWNNVNDILEQQATLQLASRALTAVGAISLLVGGVGIANIMVASVTERVPEIGLRRAIGATQREILVQFMLEAILLSLIGGIGAIATVHGLTLVVSQQFNLPYRFESRVAFIALGSAAAVGMGASFFPALQASRLDPVKALRSST